MTDTHIYDGNLNINILSDSMKENLLIINTLSLEEKREKCKEIRNIASRIFTPISLHYLDLIINSIGSEHNFDPTNNLNADDLLCLCWYYRNNNDFLNELELQLSDISTGSCPQGRTHRLFQILLAFG